ncbi:ABC transporter substrate-binding protein [Cryobacterium tagatosivorans]|uniref:ABC transporter substrate-binding protein n=1 Tax=Cryobacterium tagatosivorans TaxID=1259199 RepID=A0A4R8UJI6_9MICO|nr:ABC transporter substrate-binding protein [Cryobacterium tagatosivorans]TFB56738.1 ABC transporter substrate-binding protein [Cryobacterium tagatosivorans]
MNHTKAAVGLAIAVSSALLLGACSTDPSEGGGPTTLNIVSTEPSSGLDPATAVTQSSLRVIELMYDTLIDYDEDNNLIPMVAESWTVSDDGLTYDFVIRSDAEFSDGTAITADDAAYSIQRAADSDALKAPLAVMDSMTVVSPTELQMTLTEPSRVFLNALASTGSAAILSQKAVEADPDYFVSPTVTSGPWTLKELVPKSHATFRANPNYWNKGFPKFQTITYTFSTDTTANAATLETGTADMTYNMVPADAVRLEKAGSIQFFEAPSPGILMWGLDKSQQPFNDVNVRQAVAYMVPRSDRLEACWSGVGPVSYGDLIYEGNPLFAEGAQRFDVPADEALATAGELLDEAGWVMGADGVRESNGVGGIADGTKFAVDVPYESTWQQARCNTETLQQSLKPLGVAVTPQAYDSASFYTDVAADKFTMYHAGNNYATEDAYFAQSLTCDGSVTNLIAKWCNEEVDALIAQAQATSDITEAADLYRQVQDIILDEQPMITTGAQYAVIGASPRLKGYYPRADASNRGLIYATLTQ